MSKKYKIKYIHGYPSTIYNFLYELEENINKNEQSIITKNLRSCFFGSEYPTAQITKYIEDKWGLDYISWYGHSEMCIMAYDLDKTNMYKPFFTYGFPEQVDNKLIGTSFHNYDMPLIRYDTGDIINADYSNDGLISTFSITNGRVGEYIIDANNKSIPLTALIFGRHHKVFDYARFIQVKQIKPGSVTFYITTDKNNKNEVITDLNMNNTSIKFDVELIPKPILTRSGKVCLKINN